MLTIVWRLDDMANRQLLVFLVSTWWAHVTNSLTDFQSVRCPAYIPADGCWSVPLVSSCCVRLCTSLIVSKYRFLSLDSPYWTVLSYIKRFRVCTLHSVCVHYIVQVLNYFVYMFVSEGVLMCSVVYSMVSGIYRLPVAGWHTNCIRIAYDCVSLIFFLFQRWFTIPFLLSSVLHLSQPRSVRFLGKDTIRERLRSTTVIAWQKHRWQPFIA